MSFHIIQTVDFPQTAFEYVPQEIVGENAFKEYATLGGILSDLKHLWHAKGPSLEVRNITSGRKVGSWTFGGILKDSNTKIIGVDELKRPYGRLSLLVVALECTISGGLVCVFDIFCSKVLRVVQVREQITSLHVVDSGCENSVLPEPSPLRYFNGIVAVGTLGGNVYLLDICRQVCDKAILNVNCTIRDELNPCPMVILNKEKTNNIKKYVERSVEREEHLAIHLNVVLNPSTEHFTLKGENGEDRVHVNRTEAEVSSLFYSPQIASLLVGYNFGAFQLWDLRSLELVYTSPVCEEHIPVMHFTVQEPADDPKAYCYIWVSYCHNLMFQSGVPFAVMYSFYYDNKNYVNGYGNLYEDFQHCSIRFQIELGDTQLSSYKSRVKGGLCLGLQALNKFPINKDLNSLSLCIISWLVWDGHKEVNTFVLAFDLNQWYKEQMPRVPNWSHCSNYIIRNSLSEQVLDIKLDQKFLSQFIGIQRLDEHFCPTSLSFDLLCITEKSIHKIHNKGLQKAFIDKIVKDEHLSLIKPEEYFEQVTSLGLVPLFCEIQLNNSQDIEYQREILLNVALEQKLVGWLCQSANKLANNAFNASGLTIYSMLNWAFERAITLKNSCDQYCVSLFDYSGTRLDNNTITLINSSTVQIRNICSLYRYVSKKLMHFISDKESFLEELRSLENVVVYFEVLLWMVNIGLLPECQLKNYQGSDDSFTGAPYLVQDLTQYYNKKRAQLQMASHDTFVEKDCLLFIDNLINDRGGAEILRQQWQEDGGSGLYPPPSLQSVLRTYFLDGPDLVFKHSLVTYTLLDIAMTVDENNKVIKLLLKFPQIFDLSLSNIKIVQAFWYLDHDNYETALDYLLNPCVLTEDLHHWHHSVMMRSLLLQEQSGLALHYFQVRKPSVQNEQDLLTVISLLISKNMLDEAFTFRQQHQNPDGHSLLLHIFNECNKNDSLHTLLYRRLDNDEEKAFLKYLQSTNNPRCEDLEIFYYLLRSRFLEAFDSYSATKRRKPENQGLTGQRDATTVDSIVKMFKTLLPDINKDLVELVRKERTNLWKVVAKPTPLSVFVHNSKEQVQYKSSVFFAALSKAKQTFNDTLNDTTNDVVTEETPFLRTPCVYREVSREATPFIKCKIIEQNEQGDEYGPSPCKKLKLSPRTSKMTPSKSRNLSVSTIQSKISTPIIKRKRLSMELSNTHVVMPPSILKGSSVTRTTLDDSIFDENTSVNTSLQMECENSIRRSRLSLTPRKPVSRTPLKSHVKFDDLRYSGSSNEPSSKNESSVRQLIPETSRNQSVNSDASTIDEMFYSPDSSIEASGDKDQKTPEIIEDKTKKVSMPLVKEKVSFDEAITEDDVFMEDPSKKESEVPAIRIKDDDLSTNKLTFQSPRSRRSYKRSFADSPIPVRSSPRLSKKASEEEKEGTTSSEPTINKLESLINPSPLVAVQRVRGRKSLTRAVLENNTFSKLGSSNIFEEANNLGNKSAISSISSVNTSDNDSSQSEMDLEQSHNDSIEELLKKYRNAALSSDSSFNKNDSLHSDIGKNTDIFKEGEVISKTAEIESIETRRESVKRTDTQELVSSKETREEYHSKKVEVFEQYEPQKYRHEDPVDISIFEETTQDFNIMNSKHSRGIAEDDKKSEADGSEVSENQKSLNEYDESTDQNEEINVYDDLSSGSEDLREVLKQFKEKDRDGEKVYADISFSTSLSCYQSEKERLQMPEKFMESGGSNTNDDIPKLSQEHVFENNIDMEEMYADIPDSEKAFVDFGDVIEIGSSSDEDDYQNEIKQDTDESSRSSDERNILNVNESRSTDEENSNIKEDGVFQEEKTAGLIQNENIAEDNSEEDSNASYQKPEKTQSNTLVVSEESLSNDDISKDMEEQLQLDREEVANAVKMLQDALTEEQHVLVANDEYMDSLILEEQLPEKKRKDNSEPENVQFSDKNENRDDQQEDNEIDNSSEKEKDAILDHPDQEIENHDMIKEQKDTVNNTEINENLEEKETIVENRQSVIKEDDVSKEKLSVKEPDDQKSLSEENVLLNVEQKIAHDDGAKFKVTEAKETSSTSPVKQSIGLQCTLGVNDTLMVSSVNDDTSVFLKDDEMEGNKDEATKITDLTLGEGDSLMEPSKEDDVVVLMEDSLKNEKEEKDGTPLLLRSVKKTYAIRGRKASEASEMVNLDATPKLAVSLTKRTYSKKDLGMSSKLSNTEHLNEDSSQVQTQEASDEIQRDDGVEETNGKAKDSKQEPSVPRLELNEPKKILEDVGNNANESMIKEIPDSTQTTDHDGRKASEASEMVNLDATPKLAVSLTKRTYSKKDLGMGSKLSNTAHLNEDSSQVQTQEASDEIQRDNGVEETNGKSKDSKEEPSVPMDINEPKKSLEDVGNNANESAIKEIPDSTQTADHDESSEAKPGPSKIQSRRSSRHSIKSESSTSQKQVSRVMSLAQPKKRTRSASVDQCPTDSIRKRSVRSKSIDFDDMGGSAPDDKSILPVMLTPIQEQSGPSTRKDVPGDEVPKPSSKAYSDVGAYTSSRRLTRQQANMLKTIGTVQKEIKTLLSVEEMDPVHSLDTAEFSGNPDPDEHTVFEQTSPSNSSGTSSRNTRSASVVSDVGKSTPSKRLSKVKNEPLNIPVSGIKTRLRRQSTDAVSVASEQSHSPSPSKKSKKRDTESDAENDSQSVGSAKNRRSRTSSVSSNKSATSDQTESSIRTTRSRKIHSKSELPEIKEEGESMDTSVIRKRGRKKKD